MQSITIEFAEVRDERAACRAAQVLQTLPGIDRIMVDTTDFRITVTYDEGRTSVDEMHDTLRCSGYPARVPVHAEKQASDSCET